MTARTLALEALKGLVSAFDRLQGAWPFPSDEKDAAIAAIAALQAETGEPVACVGSLEPEVRAMANKMGFPDSTPLYTSPPPAVPQGWKLVPIEPTSEIIEAICAAVATCMWPSDYHANVQQVRRRNAKLAYLEMLSAAPGAPA